MNATPSKALNIVKTEPAVILYSMNALLALLIAYGLPLTKTQTAAVITIVTALLTVTAALATRPIAVSSVTAAVATIATAASTFGLHLTADQIGTGTTFLSLLLALVLRPNVSPTAPAAAPAQVPAPAVKA